MPSIVAPTSVPLGGVLTPRVERAIRLGSIGSALIIAISAMVLSYAGLRDLAKDAQIPDNLALLVPIMVDGLQFVGSLGVVYSTLSGLRSWYPWTLMLMGVSVSAWGNWQAAPEDLTAKMLHAAAPIILALVLEELLRVMRHKVQRHAEAILAKQEVEGIADVTPEEAKAPVFEEVRALSVLVAEGAAAAAPSVAAQKVAEPIIEAESPTAPEPIEVPVAPVVAVAPVGTPEATVEPIVEPIVEPMAEPMAEVTVEEPVEAPKIISQRTEVTAAAVVAVSAPEQVIYDDNTLPPFPEDATFKEQMKAILLGDPETAPAKIARVLGKDPSWTRKNVKMARTELEAEGRLTADGIVVAAAAETAVAGPEAAESVRVLERAPSNEADLGKAVDEAFTGSMDEDIADPFAVFANR